jgi:hypothetical protein
MAAASATTISPCRGPGSVFHTVDVRYDATAQTVAVSVDSTEVASVSLGAPLSLGDNVIYFAASNDDANATSVVTLDALTVTSDATSTTTLNRTTLTLVAVADDTTYVGTPVTLAAVSNSATYPIDSTSLFVSAATLFGYTYIVDGASIRRLNLSTNAFVAFTESAGTAPVNCDIAVCWRGRLVLAGSASDPQNFFASKAGNPLDWDTAPATTTPADAFAGNTAASGKVGQPIHALIPVSDDIMLIGCEQSLYAVRGDPADGGSIDLVSDAVGVASSTSWCIAPNGMIYFVGPRGFFRVSPKGEAPEEISQFAYPQFFLGFNRKTSYINLMYDAERRGIWIFVADTDEPDTAVTSMFYDMRIESAESVGGFWPQRFTNKIAAGPVSCVWWDGYDSDTRYPVLGGYSGGIYATNATNRTDSSGAIDASVDLGPIQPNPNAASLLEGTTVEFGEVSAADVANIERWNAGLTLKSGKSAYDVTEGTPTGTAAATFALDRRTKTMRNRLRGEWFNVKLFNNTVGQYFSMESLALEFKSAGRNRKQR